MRTNNEQNFISYIKRLCWFYFNLNSSKMLYTLIALLFFSVLYFSLFNHSEAKRPSFLESPETNSSFDYLRFTQQWPPSVCVHPDIQHCNIPNNTKFWTIHGLWGDTFNTSLTPSFCNKTWHFNQTDILPIQSELLSMWPDLMDGKASRTFWKHEWTKHGTCVANLTLLDTVLKYFTEGLQLHKTYNLLEILAKVGIEPDTTRTLDLQTISDALKENIGVNARVMCSFTKNSTLENKSKPLLSDVEICLEKSFQPFDCPNSNSTSCPSTGIFYLPISLEEKASLQ